MSNGEEEEEEEEGQGAVHIIHWRNRLAEHKKRVRLNDQELMEIAANIVLSGIIR